MDNLNIMEEIDKSMNFVMKKIHEGKLLIDILDKKSGLFIEIKNGRYNIYEEQEESRKGFQGILLLSENINDPEKFKLELRKKLWKLDSNGFIILRCANNDSKDVDLKEKEFEKFLKDEGFIDIESYIVLPNESNGEDSKQGLVITAKWHEDLLKESPEYEEYSINLVKSSKCGGCSKKSGGCESCSGGCCKK
jgi:hypothetical protein